MKKFLSILAIIPFLAVMIVYAGPPVVQGINLSSMGAIGASSVTVTGLTASKPVFTDGSKILTSSGTLGVDQGGTGATTLTDGGLLLGSGTGAITALGVATNGQIPIGDGTTDPALATLTGTANQITVTNGAGTITLSAPQSIGTASAVQFASVNINSLVYWGSATAEADEGSISLPAITANYSGHGFVRASSAGVVQDSAEFESGSDGNVSLIRGTANVVVGAACANATICVSTAAAQNPIIVQSRNGDAQIEIEFWYR